MRVTPAQALATAVEHVAEECRRQAEDLASLRSERDDPQDEEARMRVIQKLAGTLEQLSRCLTLTLKTQEEKNEERCPF